MRTASKRFRGFLAPAVLAGCLLLVWGCGDAREDQLAALVPEVSRQGRSLLLHGSDQDMEEYYGEIGRQGLFFDYMPLGEAARSGSEEDLVFLLPFLKRHARVLERLYEIGTGRSYVDFLERNSFESILLVNENIAEREKLLFDSALEDSTKVEKLKTIRAVFHSHGYYLGEVLVLADIGRLKSYMGLDPEAVAWFRQGLELSRTIGNVGMTCQLLGVLASLEKKSGRDEFAAALLDTMSMRARKSLIALHVARAEEFRGNWARAEGRLGAAHLFYTDAREVFKSYKGGRYEIRFILNLVGFYSSLECWDIVEGLVRQAEAVDLKGLNGMGKSLQDATKYPIAEMELARGNPDSSIAIAESLLEVVRPRPKPLEYIGLLQGLARYLLDAEKLDRASEIIAMGLDQSRADGFSANENTFRLLEVWLLESRGEIGQALEALADVWPVYESGRTGPPWEARLAVNLRLRLTLANDGDGPELGTTVTEALRFVQQRFTAGPPSAHYYLELQGFDEVRWFIHELIADDPVLGYEFDMAWRGLTEVARLNLIMREGAESSDIHEAVRAFANLRLGGDRKRLWDDAKLNHLLYVVTEKEIWRWTRSGRSVKRERLDWRPDLMRNTTALAVRELSQAPPAETFGVEEDLQKPLEELYRRLMPLDLVDEGGEVWISADDALTQLPFATFDRDAGEGYDPLVLTLEVGYLRFFRTGQPSDESPGGKALVVGNPAFAGAWTRGRDGLGPLPHAREEAVRAAEILSSEMVFVGDEATKANILANWSGAETIYYAGHVVRGENVPYLTVIPLAEEFRTNRPADEILEAADILQANLSKCDLVVLSGCASGAPYVEGTLTAPGLGDAFLDAGVSRSLQTLWQVVDEMVAPVMLGFISTPGDRGLGGNELAREQRQMAIRNGITAHPYFWGGYGLVTTAPR